MCDVFVTYLFHLNVCLCRRHIPFDLKLLAISISRQSNRFVNEPSLSPIFFLHFMFPSFLKIFIFRSILVIFFSFLTRFSCCDCSNRLMWLSVIEWLAHIVCIVPNRIVSYVRIVRWKCYNVYLYIIVVAPSVGGAAKLRNCYSTLLKRLCIFSFEVCSSWREKKPLPKLCTHHSIR